MIEQMNHSLILEQRKLEFLPDKIFQVFAYLVVSAVDGTLYNSIEWRTLTKLLILDLIHVCYYECTLQIISLVLHIHWSWSFNLQDYDELGSD